MDKIYSNYPVLLLVGYLVRISLNENPSYSEALIATGLVCFSIYNTYRLEQQEISKVMKELNSFKQEIEKSKAETDRKLQELEQIKTHLVSLKTANQMQNLARF